MTKILGSLTLAIALAASAPMAHGQQAEKNAPIYQVNVVGDSVTAISYQHRSGATDIGFQGTPLLVQAKGDAKVESKQGRLAIDAKFKDLVPAQRFGPEFFTYVLWAITPEGKASNLGEILLNGADSSKIQVTTSLQTFGLIVTAEPYYAVSQPSNVVVLENIVLPETAGTIEKVTAKYELLDRGEYSYNVAEENQNVAKTFVPLEVLEARNAFAIAKSAGAAQYAADALSRAQASLANAETILAHRGDRKQEVQSARDAVENAADARQITLRRKADEAAAAERAAEAKREADAQAAATAAAAKQQQDELARQQAELEQAKAELQAQQEEQARALADAKAQAEAAARQQAELDKEKAELEAQQQSQARALADAKAQQEQQAAAQAQQAAAQAQAAAARSEQEKEDLRANLLQQFSRILPTTDTSRGLKVNMADVLFDTAKYDLQPAAREALAKLSGIVEAHPGLKLQIEGYTDSVGSDAYNQTLSESRASSVRAYLVSQGVDPAAVTSIGYGKSNPVASNDSVTGRKQNRRVEIIISGEIIGTQIGGGNPPPSSQQ
ncbi:MAG: OmpA family protein [Candidatus Acidiferrales bacterium]